MEEFNDMIAKCRIAVDLLSNAVTPESKLTYLLNLQTHVLKLLMLGDLYINKVDNPK